MSNDKLTEDDCTCAGLVSCNYHYPPPKPPTVTISRECAERSHVRASYYLQAAYNKAVGPEALKDFNELEKALMEVQSDE